MPNPVLGLIGSVAGSAISANSQKKAASEASDAQVRAAEISTEERRRQFDKIQQLLAPFVEGGSEAFQGALGIAGLAGPGSQRAAIRDIEQSPEFRALAASGEDAILQNQAATGGVRGGNTQGILGQFRPQLLSGLVDKQFSRLQGLSAIGQSSAAQTGVAAQNLASGVSQDQQMIGAAQAGGALASGQATQNFIGNTMDAFGGFAQAGPRPENAGFFDRWGF